MRTADARTSRSLAPSRWIARVGLLAGVLALLAPPAGAGTTERVSVASDGTQGNSSSHFPSISADGRFVAFTSSATNLVPDGSGYAFIHDRQTGTTERAVGVRFSADGRFVGFARRNNPPPMGSRYSLFIRDRQTGTDEPVRRGI